MAIDKGQQLSLQSPPWSCELLPSGGGRFKLNGTPNIFIHVVIGRKDQSKLNVVLLSPSGVCAAVELKATILSAISHPTNIIISLRHSNTDDNSAMFAVSLYTYLGHVVDYGNLYRRHVPL